MDYGLPTDHVKWTVTADPATIPPGGDTRVHVHAEIGKGWKMYALDSPAGRPVAVRFDELPQGLSLSGAVTQREPKVGFDPNFGKDVRYFEGSADLYATLAAAEEITPGAQEATGSIQFMICNDSVCLPPTRVPFTLPITVAALQDTGRNTDASGAANSNSGAGGSGGTAGIGSPEAVTGREKVPVPGASEESAGAPADLAEQNASIVPEVDLDVARSGGIWGFLLLAVGAGIGALLTPCVFPMIPLTVSFFTRHAGERGEAVRMAGVYGAAIVLTFTGLGLLMALLLGAAGAQTIAANPWINLFIGVVFVVFSLSLLGLFELRLPSGLVNYFNRQGNERGGYLGVIFMGLTLTLVSFSCTAPFVGGLLAATVQGERLYPVAGMLAFSLTFALPFIAFALFPRALSVLPKSGAWMNAVKVVLGFVELAAALKFLSNADLIWGWNLISRPLAIAVTAVIFFLAGLYLLGKLPLAHEEAPERIGVGRLLAAIGFFGVALYILPGLFGAPLNKLDAYLPPRQGTDVNLFAAIPGGMLATGAGQGEDVWFTDDLEGAFAEAAQTARPVFIDFTGYTCTNCREMEANVFTRPEVQERFQNNFVLVRLYTDGLEKGNTFQRYQLQTTGTVALPTYAIVDPTGERLIARLTGVASPAEFVDFLDNGASAFRQRSLAASGFGL